MKTFYSAEEIETLAAQGMRELAVDDDTVLTAVAREMAARLGVRLVGPGAGQAGRAAAAAPMMTAQKPRGCQHGSLGGVQPGAPARATSTGNSPVVDDLIGTVKRLAKRD